MSDSRDDRVASLSKAYATLRAKLDQEREKWKDAYRRERERRKRFEVRVEELHEELAQLRALVERGHRSDASSSSSEGSRSSSGSSPSPRQPRTAARPRQPRPGRAGNEAASSRPRPATEVVAPDSLLAGPDAAQWGIVPFDEFVVVSCSPEEAATAARLRSTARPRVMQRFGSGGGSSSEHHQQAVASFCFPSGIAPSTVDVRQSLSDLHMTLNAGHRLDSEDTARFIFVLTGGNPGGLVRRIDASEESLATDAGADAVPSPEQPLARGSWRGLLAAAAQRSDPGLLGQGEQLAVCVVTSELRAAGSPPTFFVLPLCYCLVTSLPVLTLQWEVMRVVLALEKHRRQVWLATAERGLRDVGMAGPPLGERALAFLAAARRAFSFSSFSAHARVVVPAPPLPDDHALAVTWDALRRLESDAPFAPHDDARIAFQRLARAAGGAAIPQLLAWVAVTVVERVPLHLLLAAVAAALLEYKVVVRASDPRVASAVTVAIAALLHPLRWSFPLVPLLPAAMADMLDAPFPVLVGITAPLPALAAGRHASGSGGGSSGAGPLLVLDVDQGRVGYHLPAHTLRELPPHATHALSLPHSAVLCLDAAEQLLDTFVAEDSCGVLQRLWLPRPDPPDAADAAEGPWVLWADALARPPSLDGGDGGGATPAGADTGAAMTPAKSGAGMLSRFAARMAAAAGPPDGRSPGQATGAAGTRGSGATPVLAERASPITVGGVGRGRATGGAGRGGAAVAAAAAPRSPWAASGADAVTEAEVAALSAEAAVRPHLSSWYVPACAPPLLPDAAAAAAAAFGMSGRRRPSGSDAKTAATVVLWAVRAHVHVIVQSARARPGQGSVSRQSEDDAPTQWFLEQLRRTQAFSAWEQPGSDGE